LGSINEMYASCIWSNFLRKWSIFSNVDVEAGHLKPDVKPYFVANQADLEDNGLVTDTFVKYVLGAFPAAVPSLPKGGHPDEIMAAVSAAIDGYVRAYHSGQSFGLCGIHVLSTIASLFRPKLDIVWPMVGHSINEINQQKKDSNYTRAGVSSFRLPPKNLKPGPFARKLAVLTTKLRTRHSASQQHELDDDCGLNKAKVDVSVPITAPVTSDNYILTGNGTGNCSLDRQPWACMMQPTTPNLQCCHAIANYSRLGRGGRAITPQARALG
jgi:hypothetical protein